MVAMLVFLTTSLFYLGTPSYTNACKFYAIFNNDHGKLHRILLLVLSTLSLNLPFIRVDIVFINILNCVLSICRNSYCYFLGY